MPFKKNTTLEYAMRNDSIIRMFKHRFREGQPPIPVAEIANKHGIARQRVYQIIAEHDMQIRKRKGRIRKRLFTNSI